MSAQAAGPSAPAAAAPSGGLGLTFSASRCAERRRRQPPFEDAAARQCRRRHPCFPRRCSRLRLLPASLHPHPCARRLEDVYLVYTAEKNRGLTLRLHFMLVAAWAVGALKTLSQSVHAYQQ